MNTDDNTRDQMPPWVYKDPNLITSDMKKKENCPCPGSPEIVYDCVFRGYCVLCREFHKKINFPYCTLPPGKDKYLVPWVEGTAASKTYAAIKPPPKEIKKKADCPCSTKCCYNGYCVQCKEHSEKYQACFPSCNEGT